jgi:uncharacterized protein (TIGR02118 family)
MIRASVFYPGGEGATFDHDYYRDRHIPMVKEAWGVERVEVDTGLNGPYVAAAHIFFESMDALQAAMGSPRTGEVMGDLTNYTNTTPVMQISETS